MSKWHKFRQQQQQQQKVNSTITKTLKKIFNIDDTDVNKILVSKKEQYGKYNSFKYFIGLIMMLLDHYV